MPLRGQTYSILGLDSILKKKKARELGQQQNQSNIEVPGRTPRLVIGPYPTVPLWVLPSKGQPEMSLIVSGVLSDCL